MTDWVDIVLESQDLTEANVQEISQAQYCSDVIARYASEELYFYDQNDLRYINDDENEGLDRVCAKYRAVLDIDRGVIEWYSINNGSESTMPSIKMK